MTKPAGQPGRPGGDLAEGGDGRGGGRGGGDLTAEGGGDDALGKAEMNSIR